MLAGMAQVFIHRSRAQARIFKWLLLFPLQSSRFRCCSLGCFWLLLQAAGGWVLLCPRSGTCSTMHPSPRRSAFTPTGEFQLSSAWPLYDSLVLMLPLSP